MESGVLVERQTQALFGDLKALQRDMQEAVGQDAADMVRAAAAGCGGGCWALSECPCWVVARSTAMRCGLASSAPPPPPPPCDMPPHHIPPAPTYCPRPKCRTPCLLQEEIMSRVQQAVAEGRVESVTMTVGTQRRAVLEAVAYGCFLRDVEGWVDSEYGLLTPVGGGGGGGPAADDPE